MSPLDHAEDLAKELAGNHRKFESFGWHDRPEDDTEWCIVYTTNRDADALTRSNARVIGKALEPYCTGEDNADCREEHHGHWACGWVDGYAIRVRRNGELTPAFLAYAELATALSDYPVLDDGDFSNEEHEEAQLVWSQCYKDSSRLEYIRDNREQFEFHSFADMLGCVRGKCFAGYASELIR
jgi:hypothetical protein